MGSAVCAWENRVPWPFAEDKPMLPLPSRRMYMLSGIVTFWPDVMVRRSVFCRRCVM